jgi:hypothetical protein
LERETTAINALTQHIIGAAIEVHRMDFHVPVLKHGIKRIVRGLKE